MTALVASSIIRMFEHSIERLAVLAVLMPIVAGVGGNAGTQTLAVTVRAIATNQLTGSNRWRAVGRELRVASMNGLTIALLVGIAVTLLLGSAQLGLVIAAAMLTNIVVAGLAGVLVPLTHGTRRRRPGGRVVDLRHDGHRFDGLPGVPRAGDLGRAGPLRVESGAAFPPSSPPCRSISPKSLSPAPASKRSNGG